MPFLRGPRRALLNAGSPNPFLFLAPLNGSLAFRDKQGTGTLTGTGAVRYQAASGARINLVHNPRFATNTNGWLASGGTALIARVADTSMPGGFGVQVDATTTAHGIVTNNGTGRITPGSAFVCSFSGYSLSGATDWELVWQHRDAAGSVLGSSAFAQFALTPLVQRFEFSGTPSTTGTHSLNIVVRRKTTAAGSAVFSGFQLESGSAATDYFDGSTGAWLDPLTGQLGTAHASPSVSQAAAWVEEGTTNVLTNPSAENASVGLGMANPGSTVTKDTAYAYIGSSSFKVVTSNAISGEGINIQTATALALNGSANPYTGQLRIRGSGTVNVYVFVSYTDATFDNLSGTIKSSLTLTDEWQRVTPAAVTLNAAKTVDYMAVTVRTQTQQAATFYVDAVQLEQKAYATSYCDGSLGTGYAWSGTANASSSTRTAASLTYPNKAQGAQGALVARVRLDRLNPALNYVGEVGRYSSATEDGILLHVSSTGALMARGFYNAGLLGTATKTSAITAATWAMPYLSWRGTAAEAGVDNGSTATATLSARLDAHGMGSGSTYIGWATGAAAGQELNGLIGPVAIFARPLTTRERTRLNVLSQWDWRILDAA